MLKDLVKKLRMAQSVVLSTHRHCDGDGLGAQLALYHGLNKLGLKTRLLNVDRPAQKYAFLGFSDILEVFDPGKTELDPTDLAIILDTNDQRLVEPLFSDLQRHCGEVIFVDHHPVLAKGPIPTSGSIIDITAASTGELSYKLLKLLNVDFDALIARALYTSLVFDTQLFRYVKATASSHLIAADLLKYERAPEEVHRHLFASYTVEKMRSLMKALSYVEYFNGDQLAFIPFRLQPGDVLDRDESGDVIDQVMNIGTVEVAALLREDGPKQFKLSLRSRGTVEVLSLAESFGGGGHRYASGAHLKGDFPQLRDQLLKSLQALISNGKPT
jgi:phosphoesterase RecJ-like protein